MWIKQIINRYITTRKEKSEKYKHIRVTWKGGIYIKDVGAYFNDPKIRTRILEISKICENMKTCQSQKSCDCVIIKHRS